MDQNEIKRLWYLECGGQGGEMIETGDCHGEAMDAIYGGAHRPRVQSLCFNSYIVPHAQLNLTAKKSIDSTFWLYSGDSYRKQIN